jgi:hypothetical protein
VIDNDEDLAAVRAVVAPRVTGPAPDWAAVAGRRTAAPPRPARAWARLAVPAGVAALVAAVALGGVLLVRADGPAAPGAEPGSSQTPGDEPSEQRANQGPSSPEAVAVLTALAEAARGVEPVELAPGQLIYVRSVGGRLSRTEGQADPSTPNPTDHRVWLDPEGMIALRIVSEGEDITSGDAEIASARRYLADVGPHIRMATPAWLKSLPTDPDALLTLLRAGTRDDIIWSSDQQIMDQLRQLYHAADILLPTELRVGLLGAMARLTGLTARTVTIDGNDYVAIRRAEDTETAEILFEPDTGRAVGDRSIEGPDFFTTPGPGVPERVTGQSLWTAVVVDRVGDTS